MAGTIVPIGQGQRRLPQAGRIRIGIKDSSIRAGRRAIDTFRFTAQDPTYLETIAALYGGVVKPWNEPKSPDRFEVITETNKVNVLLPTDCYSEWYELWDGSGLERRCDGITCTHKVSGPEGSEMVEADCICVRQGIRECEAKLRVSFILPEVASWRTWRLDTSSENARAEMEPMIKLIRSLQGQGIQRGVLRLDQRRQPGHHFNVPALDVDMSVDELMAGETSLSLPSAPEPVLPPAIGPAALAQALDDVIEAEVVEDAITGEHPVDPDLARSWIDSLTGHQKSKALLRARALARELGEPEPTSAAAISVPVIDQLMREMNT